MDAPTIAVLASLAVALVAFVGLAGPVYLRLGRLEEEVKAGKERADALHAETLSEIRSLTDAFLSHSHATDGGIIFRIPPPAGMTPQE